MVNHKKTDKASYFIIDIKYNQTHLHCTGCIYSFRMQTLDPCHALLKWPQPQGSLYSLNRNTFTAVTNVALRAPNPGMSSKCVLPKEKREIDWEKREKFSGMRTPHHHHHKESQIGRAAVYKPAVLPTCMYVYSCLYMCDEVSTYTRICTPTVGAASLTRAKTENQLTCVLMDEWIKTMWQMCNISEFWLRNCIREKGCLWSCWENNSGLLV